MTMRPPGRHLRWQQADPFLLLAALGLTGLGVVLVTSATWKYPDHPSLVGNPWFLKQLLFAIVGSGAMVACAMVPPSVLRTLSLPLYAVSLGSLAAVLVFGHGMDEYGAQRWVGVAGVALQPSEPAKLALALALAQVMANQPAGLRSILLSGALVAPAALLVYLQPDLGTTLSLLAIWFGMVLLSGVPARYIAALVGMAAAVSPLVWLGLKDYMRARVLIFMNPQADALGEGYNILQAQISIGSGGMWGKGLLEGTQTQLRYLRVSHSDFIFSVLGEELGFIGAMLLFGLLLMVLFRILRAYDTADDRFAGLICAGIAWMIGFPSLANLAANLGLIPIVGIPLPFMSYGGSALMSYLTGLGMVQGTLMRRRLYRFEA